MSIPKWKRSVAGDNPAEDDVYEMSPGRRWAIRCLIGEMAYGCSLHYLARLFEPGFLLGQQLVTFLFLVAALWYVKLVWANTYGKPLDPPGSYAPDRYPPDQRDRGRMGWGEAVFLWPVAVLFFVGCLYSTDDAIRAVMAWSNR